MDDSQVGGGRFAPGEPGAASSAGSIVAAAERLAAEITQNAEADADAIRARAGSDTEAARAATADRVRRLSTLADGMLEQLREMRAELDSLSASLAGAGAAGVEPATAGVPEPVAVPVAPEPGVDDAGARLIALNLALSDTPREEAARQLRDQVADPERLVDEVYASVDR
jgi:hypothetical protein